MALKKRTVLHIIDTLLYAGAQRYVLLIAQWSSPQHFTHIICVLQPHTELKGQIEATGTKVVCLNRNRPSIFHPLRFVMYAYHNLRDIMRLCADEHADIIQCHLSDAEFLGIAAGALCRIKKIITTVHGPLPLLPPRPVRSLRNYLRRHATKILYRWTDHVVAVSEEVAREIHALFGVEHSKIRTVINRIDTQSYARVPVSEQARMSLGLRPEHRVITTVARFAPHKGHACLIDAVHALKQQHEEIRLFLVGDGECREELEAKCSAQGIRDSVYFLGNRGDIPVILALTEIFVFPTYAEGTSLALMEAMAAGKPIVATNIPGNAALLEHGKSALLVAPGDAHAMNEAILFLLENPDVARAYGHEARSVVTRSFDIRETMAELERLWGNAS